LIRSLRNETLAAIITGLEMFNIAVSSVSSRRLLFFVYAQLVDVNSRRQETDVSAS
jgi:hypothetical protein